MLETIWFLLWGLLWSVYFMLDGFDLGLGTLIPFLGRNDFERRLIYRSVEPYWDGNEVWLITAGGVTFAAFPGAYATIFSAFYTPLMIILFALIVRAVSIEFRGKREDKQWRSLWDWTTAVGSFLPAFLFGVAFANIFRGIPVDGEGVFHGSILTFFNLYGVTGGFFFFFLFLVHGLLWFAIKTVHDIRERSMVLSGRLWFVSIIFGGAFLVLSAFYTGLYGNYLRMPCLFLVPAVAVIALVAVRFFIGKASAGKAWIASSCSIVFSVFFGVIGLYPNLLPSSIDPGQSVTVFNSASSPLTLKIMLVVAVIFVPTVIAYQGWAYRLFLKKYEIDEVMGPPSRENA